MSLTPVTFFSHPQMTLKSLFLSLLFFILSLSAHPSFASEDEVRSLLEFKKGIKVDPLNLIFSTWNSTADPNATASPSCPSTFYGVFCDPTAKFVVAIVLEFLGLSGELKFATLTGLKQLQNLSLSGNAFTGRLVPALGLISSLQHLDLSNNQFYGPIPARLNDLWGLNYLNLSKNNYTGGFPSGIQNLQQLKVLDLHSNGIQGDITELFPQLRNVEHLDLSVNEFFGSLSDMSVENVSSLANTVQYVSLSHNRLGGGLLGSDAIGLFRNLKFLDLGYNEIGGELPSFGALLNLQVLRLGSNGFSGSIPVEFLEGLVPLLELDLSGNGFSGSFQIINSTSLKTLNLSSNALSGALPASLGNCSIVDLSRNNISDDIIAIGNWGASLEIIDLSSNKLTGSFPNVSHFQQLTSLNLGNNSLVGEVPEALGTFPRLVTLDLSLNQLDGSIPENFFTSTALTNLNLSGNHLTGSIPFEGSHTSQLLVLKSYLPMASLDLSNNSLTSLISSDIGNLRMLKLLNLASNQLSGDLPNELSDLRVLEYLDLSHNHFTGEIPDGIGPKLRVFNVSYNELKGRIPESLQIFPDSSFRPGNGLLIFPPGRPAGNHDVPTQISDEGGKHHGSKTNIKIAIIVASVGAGVIIAFLFLAYYRSRPQDFLMRSRRSGQAANRDVKLSRFTRPSILNFHTTEVPPLTALSLSNDHLLTSNSRSLSGPTESGTEIVEHVLPMGATTGSTSERKSSPGSPIASSPRFSDSLEQPVTLDVYSPDRLAGELSFLDSSLPFTAEALSRAPAEVLGRSSHGTLYKATLDGGHMLTVKWLRVGLVKHKKEFAKEVKKIGSMRHPNIVPLRAYYWGPREQERLILADYIHGDSLALHLYETTPRRYSLLSFAQRLKVAVDVARCLVYLHDKGMPHGNLKPTNILLAGSDQNVHVTDYGLHRLMTPAGIAEQILNLGALGYRAPELASASKPTPSLKSDVYAFGVIVMELLTRRSAGDIISGQSGAVDLTDWVRLCDREGRGMDCIDRDISGGEEHLRAMDELLAISLRCILPVNERPNIRQVFEGLHSISV